MLVLKFHGLTCWSCNIIRQALEKMPKSGSIRTKLKPNPKGGLDEVYRGVESGRGAAGCYIVSKETQNHTD